MTKTPCRRSEASPRSCNSSAVAREALFLSLSLSLYIYQSFCRFRCIFFVARRFTTSSLEVAASYERRLSPARPARRRDRSGELRSRAPTPGRPPRRRPARRSSLSLSRCGAPLFLSLSLSLTLSVFPCVGTKRTARRGAPTSSCNSICDKKTCWGVSSSKSLALNSRSTSPGPGSSRTHGFLAFIFEALSFAGGRRAAPTEEFTALLRRQKKSQPCCSEFSEPRRGVAASTDEFSVTAEVKNHCAGTRSQTR